MMLISKEFSDKEINIIFNILNNIFLKVNSRIESLYIIHGGMMNKKIKVLAIFNIISYIVMGMLSYIINNNLSSRLDNKFKFVIGSIPLLLITCTSFIIADDRFKELKIVKKEAIVDWVVRIVAFGIALIHTNSYNIKALILVALVINIIIEYRMNRKLINTKQELVKEEVLVSLEERKNLKNFVMAVNAGMLSILIFSGGALSVPITKNMEGTTKSWFIPVIVSILVFRWFIKTTYKNYSGYYLDKEEGKRAFKKDIIFASIGYLICLIFSFVNMDQQWYSLITIIGILFTFPLIETMRKMSLRLKVIKDSLDKDTFNYFLVEYKEVE